MVSGLNATDKTPMYEMPLIFVFRAFGVGVSIFCNGVLGNGILSLEFCPEILLYRMLSAMFSNADIVVY